MICLKSLTLRNRSKIRNYDKRSLGLLGKNQRRINTILQMLILMNLEKQKLLKRLNLQLLRAQLNTIILIIMVSLLPKNKQMLLKGKKFTRMTMPLLLKVSFKPVKNKN